ncbi:ankyrin repeat domain-containing protein 53 [Erinaceus europaeus]|uniref:Ankyrin repeat domain-containing protein 53 n=1 Tax=Erinaceus europaeus TaxID=9365 RepID=A0A1S2ZS90_ERIEU|nr:ankyrin repeat domain-containing protein 53 [Erinaceus europaeus]
MLQVHEERGCGRASRGSRKWTHGKASEHRMSWRPAGPAGGSRGEAFKHPSVGAGGAKGSLQTIANRLLERGLPGPSGSTLRIPPPDSARPSCISAKHSQDKHEWEHSTSYGGSYELFAAARGNLEWLRYCLKRHRSAILADDKGFTAIHFAAQGTNLSCLQALVEEYKFPVDLPTNSGHTPLHLTIQKNKATTLACMNYLIKKGADVNFLTNNGSTPLHLAAREGLLSCVKVLVQNGANVHAQDAMGCKPIDYCKIWNYRSCARFLKDAMWKRDKKDYDCEMQKLKKLKGQLALMEESYLIEYQKEHQILRANELKRWLHQKLLQSKEQKPGGSARGLPFSRSPKHQGLFPPKSFYPSPEACLGKRQSLLQSLVKPKLIYTSPSIRLLRQQKLWNFSHNPARPPVTQIGYPQNISLGVHPDPSREDDLCNFLEVKSSRQKGVVLHTTTGDQVEPLPRLPFEVIIPVLCPSVKPYRMKVPRGLCSISMKNIAHKRHCSGKTFWTDTLAMNLRETFDETFLAALRAHQELPALPSQTSS